MVDIIVEVATLFIIMSLVPMTLRYFSGLKDKKKQPLDNFGVYAPTQYLLFFILMVVFNIIAAIFFFYTYKPWEEYHKYSYMMTFYAFMWLMVSIWTGTDRIKVRGDKLHIRYITALMFKTVTFDDIQSVRVDSDRGLLLTVNGKTLRIDKDAIGLPNLVKRCEGIKNTIVKPITRRNLMFSATLIFMAWLFFFLIAPFVCLYEGLLMGVLETLIFVGVIILMCMIIPFGSYLKLRRMEKVLNIDFNEEMRKKGIDSTYYQDDEWFICQNQINFFVVHKDYINNISQVMGEKNEQGKGTYVVIETIDGKKVKTSLYESDVDAFVNWYKQL